MISLSFFSLTIFLDSCYEPIEGCLDIESSNYMVSADRACDSCCVFPNFNLVVDKTYNGEDFSSSDTLTNSVGNQFRLTDYFIVLSGFEIASTDEVNTVTDSIEITCNGIESFVTNDMIVVQENTNLVTVGSWNKAGGYTNIDFILGLDDCFHSNGFSGISESDRLSQLDTLYDSTLGFTTLSLEINDEMTIALSGTNGIVNLENPLLTSSVSGSVLVLNLSIDFGIWLDNIDFTASEDIISSQIKENASTAISISQ